MAMRRRPANNDSFGGKASVSKATKTYDPNASPTTRAKRMNASRAEVASAVTGARQIASTNRTKAVRAQAAAAKLPNQLASNRPRPMTQAQKRAEMLAAKQAAAKSKIGTGRARPAGSAPRTPRSRLPGTM